MDTELADSLIRAANALDAASAVFSLSGGEVAALHTMLSIWLLDEAEALRSVVLARFENVSTVGNCPTVEEISFDHLKTGARSE